MSVSPYQVQRKIYLWLLPWRLYLYSIRFTYIHVSGVSLAFYVAPAMYSFFFLFAEPARLIGNWPTEISPNLHSTKHSSEVCQTKLSFRAHTARVFFDLDTASNSADPIITRIRYRLCKQINTTSGARLVLRLDRNVFRDICDDGPLSPQVSLSFHIMQGQVSSANWY